jgi:hypothetical protein
MLKIQLVAKLVDKNIEIIDHIFEIVIPYNNENYNKSNNETSMELYIKKIERNVIIQDYNELILGTLNAYTDRIIYSEQPEYTHKSINHIGRFFYICELLNHYLDKPNTFNSISLLTNGKISPYLSTILFAINYKISLFIRKYKHAIFKYYKIDPVTKNLSIIDIPFSTIFIAYIRLFFNLRTASKSVTDYDTIIQRLFKNRNELFNEPNNNVLQESDEYHKSILKIIQYNTAYSSLKGITNKALVSIKLKSKKTYRSIAENNVRGQVQKYRTLKKPPIKLKSKKPYRTIAQNNIRGLIQKSTSVKKPSIKKIYK